MVEALLAASADIEARDDSARTPLHLAVISEHIEVVQALLQHSANVNAATKTNNTPLHFAATKSVTLCEILVDHGADRELRNVCRFIRW